MSYEYWNVNNEAITSLLLLPTEICVEFYEIFSLCGGGAIIPRNTRERAGVCAVADADLDTSLVHPRVGWRLEDIFLSSLWVQHYSHGQWQMPSIVKKN